MKERLVIKNFGPIKSVDLGLGKMTILIGEQATGKSTIAKVLAVCRYFSYIVNYSIRIDRQNQFHINEQFYDGLVEWDIKDFLKNDAYISYKNSMYEFEFKSELVVENEDVGEGQNYKKEYFKCLTNIKSVSAEFSTLLTQLDDLRTEEYLQKKQEVEFFHPFAWSPNENFYRLNVKKIMDNPLFIPTERVLQSISFSNNLLISEALQNELYKLNRIVRGWNIEMLIEPLSLLYKNQYGLGYTKKEGEEEYHLLHNGASGYQSTIPIVLALKFYNKKRTFVVEEPELNLFPKAQKKLIEFFVENINRNGHSFVLPTHSPYILSSINNLVYAYCIANINDGVFRDRVKEIIPEKYWLNPDDISVYYLNDEGTNTDIFNRQENLINTDYIDSVSRVISKEFDELLNMEISLTAEDND